MQTTIHANEIPPAGTPLAGGYATALYRCGDQTFLLITAPKEAELTDKWHEQYEDVPGARSFTDGLANTVAMAASGSKLAAQVIALTVGGCNDWAIPASHQQELQYRHLKPTEERNYCSWRDGENAAAMPPTLPYTEESPAQTPAEAFRAGGAEAFESRWYWSSTQSSAGFAWTQGFGGGSQYSYGGKDFEGAVRPVRRLLVIQ